MPEYENGKDLSYKLFEGEEATEEHIVKDILDKIEVSGSILSSPLLVNDTLFFGSNDNHLYAVTLDGTLKWKFRAGHIIISEIVEYKGVLFFGSFDNYFYAISAEDGKLLWRFRTGNRIMCTPAVADDKIYFGSEDCHLYCLSLEGEEIWRFRTGDAILSSPMVINGVAYFGSFDKRFYAVKDGQKLWSILAGGAVCTPTAANNYGEDVGNIRSRSTSSFRNDMSNGVLCVGSYDNYLYLLSMDGRVLSKFKTGGGFALSRSPFCYKGAVYFGSFDSYFYALSIKEGRKIWQFKTGDPISGSPLINRDVLFVGSTDGCLYSLTTKGDLLWKYKTNGPITATPLLFNDSLYIPSWDTYLYAISLKGPEVIWRFQSGYGSQTSMKVVETMQHVSRLQRLIGRIWKPETKKSTYEKEAPQQKFTFGAAYRMHEPYKSGVEYESGSQYSMDRKKKDWRQAR